MVMSCRTHRPYEKVGIYRNTVGSLVFRLGGINNGNDTIQYVFKITLAVECRPDECPGRASSIEERHVKGLS